MGRVQDLAAIGFNPAEAKHLGFDAAVSLSATGNNSQANAYELTANWNQFTTVTAAANSVKLPVAVSSAFGQYVVLNDDSADNINLFPGSGDSFNALSANVSISIPSGCMAHVFRVGDTKWLASISIQTVSDLAAIEALAGTAGVLCKTAANAWALRTIGDSGAGLTWADGDGAAGNPTISLSNDLAQVEGLGGTGLATRIGTDSWTTRTITGTANQITVTNGDGVAGGPSLATPQDIATSSKPTFAGVISTGTIDINNNTQLRWKDSGGTDTNILNVNSGDVTVLNSVSGQPIRFQPGGSSRWNISSTEIAPASTNLYAIGTASLRPSIVQMNYPGFSHASVGAAGTTSGTATLLAAFINRVSTGTLNQGLRLPTPLGAGHAVWIKNNTGVTLQIYPNTGDNIEGLGNDVAAPILTAQAFMYIYTGTEWFLWVTDR
jgi:hypothetical protein